MPEHIQYKEDDLFNPETHHEHSDVPVSPLLWFIVLFIVLSFVTHFLILFLYKGLVSAERKRMDPPETQVARPLDSSVPKNQPLLQPFPHQDADQNFVVPNRNTPVTDMVAMRRAQDETLHSYGWVDPQHTVARIPIDEAKRLFAERYTAPATPSGAPASLSAATPASSQQPQGGSQ